MSTRLQFTKGQKCGKEDNCKSTLYYWEDGFKYCKRGHLQEVKGNLSQLRVEPNGVMSREYQHSKMRMTLAPRVERPASEGRHKKWSRKVGLRPVTPLQNSASLTASSLQRHHRYGALPSILPAHPLETMLYLDPHHWPASRARDRGQRLMGVTIAVVEKQDWCYL